MTASQSLKLYKIASKYFTNQDDASQFINEIENAVDIKFEDKKTILATREFVKEEIASIKEEIFDVKKEIAEAKADLIKWMFIFWIGQLGATIAIILLYVKK